MRSAREHEVRGAREGGDRLEGRVLPESFREPFRGLALIPLERFPAKWMPVRVKKTLKNKELEPRSDSIGSEEALVRAGVGKVRKETATIARTVTTAAKNPARALGERERPKQERSTMRALIAAKAAMRTIPTEPGGDAPPPASASAADSAIS